MTSAIDVTKPQQGEPKTAEQRANWAAAKNEIEALQSRATALESTKCTGLTWNDAAAAAANTSILQAFITAAQNAGAFPGVDVVGPPGGTIYLADPGITVDVGKLGYLWFHGSRIRCNHAGDAGDAITLTGSYTVGDGIYNQSLFWIGGAHFLGPSGGTSRNGIVFSGSGSAGSCYARLRDIRVSGFNVGIYQKGPNVYCNNLDGVTVMGCTTGLQVDNASNSGENISWVGGAISQNGTGVSFDGANADLHLHDISITFNTTTAIAQTAGQITMHGGHMESNSASQWWNISGNGACCTHIGTRLAQTNTSAGNADWASVASPARLDFINCSAAGFAYSTSAPARFGSGTGRITWRDSAFYDISTMPATISSNLANSQWQGDSEYSGIDVPFLSVVGGAANWAGRSTGTNGSVARSTAQHNNGAASLAITKTAGVGSAFTLTIFVPIRPGAICSFDVRGYNPNSISGTYYFSIEFVAKEKTDVGLYTRAWSTGTLVTSGAVTLPTGAWGYAAAQTPNSNVGMRAPMGATDIMLTFNFTSMAAGTWFFDDLNVSCW